MKTFDELTPEQQERAIEAECNYLLKRFCEGSLVFVEGADERRIFDECVEEMEAMHTPWFLHETVWGRLGDVIRRIAAHRSEAYWYSEPDDPYIVQSGVFT